MANSGRSYEQGKRIRPCEQGGCPTGEAVITTAGKLPAKYVIHTVGRVWRGGQNDEPRLLANCYRNSLELAVRHGVTSVAFPKISIGVYHFPKEQAAEIVLKTVVDFLEGDNSIKKVFFVCFDRENYELYQKARENVYLV